MRRVPVVTLIAAFAPLVTQAQRPARAPVVKIDYVEDSLPNGLTVLYHVDHSTPVAAVDIWYNVGSKNEEVGRTGFAHLFEHMMFKGSRNVADGQHFALLEAAGGRAGSDINGTTWTDRTNYFESVPSNQLELALWLEADRMGTLTETLTPEKLENQREVVKNERRETFDNQPYGSWFEKLMAYSFPEEHPYHHAVIGSMRDLSAATVEDVRKFFRTYYAPNNAVLTIAGDIDVAQAKAAVRKYFGGIPRGPAVPPLADMRLPPVMGTEQRAVLQDENAPAPAVYVSFRVPPAKDSAWAVVSLLGSVIADGKSSKLFASLVREQQIAANVFGGNFGLVDGADVLFFAAVGKPGGDPAALEHALLEAIERAKGEISQEDLDRVRAGARFSFVDGLQTMGGFGGRADRLDEGYVYHHNPNYVNTVLDKYDAVTLAQLRALAGERLVPLNRVTLVYVPKTQQVSARATP